MVTRRRGVAAAAATAAQRSGLLVAIRRPAARQKLEKRGPCISGMPQRLVTGVSWCCFRSVRKLQTRRFPAQHDRHVSQAAVTSHPFDPSIATLRRLVLQQWRPPSATNAIQLIFVSYCKLRAPRGKTGASELSNKF